MTTKELIQEEIDDLSEEELKEVYRMLKEFTRVKSKNNKQSLMSKLRNIRIDGPEDFAANFDQYTCGEKHVE